MNDGKFVVTASTGAAQADGTLQVSKGALVTGNLSVNGGKFVVTAASGEPHNGDTKAGNAGDGTEAIRPHPLRAIKYRSIPGKPNGDRQWRLVMIVCHEMQKTWA